MVGRQDRRQPLMHLREWQEDCEARLAVWEAQAGRGEREQKARPKRRRKAASSPLALRMLPWSPATWTHLLDFQETLRAVDRRLRRFLVHTDDQVLLGRLAGRLMLGPAGEEP